MRRSSASSSSLSLIAAGRANPAARAASEAPSARSSPNQRPLSDGGEREEDRAIRDEEEAKCNPGSSSPVKHSDDVRRERASTGMRVFCAQPACWTRALAMAATFFMCLPSHLRVPLEDVTRSSGKDVCRFDKRLLCTVAPACPRAILLLVLTVPSPESQLPCPTKHPCAAHCALSVACPL